MFAPESSCPLHRRTPWTPRPTVSGPVGRPRSPFAGAGNERGWASLSGCRLLSGAGGQSPAPHLLCIEDPETPLARPRAQMGSTGPWLIFTADLPGEVLPEPPPRSPAAPRPPELCGVCACCLLAFPPPPAPSGSPLCSALMHSLTGGQAVGGTGASCARPAPRPPAGPVPAHLPLLLMTWTTAGGRRARPCLLSRARRPLPGGSCWVSAGLDVLLKTTVYKSCVIQVYGLNHVRAKYVKTK